MCDVPDRFDLTQGSCKLRMNVHALCNVGSFFTCWETACFKIKQFCGLDDQGIIGKFDAGVKFSHLQSIQTTSDASPATCSVRAQGKVAGPGSNPHPSIHSLCGS
jgi:hypothetical protein